MNALERLHLTVPPGHFRELLKARIASTIGDYLAAIALSVEMLHQTHSAVWVGLLLMAKFAPVFVLGSFAGPLLDRGHRKRILINADLINAGVFVLLVFAHTPVALLVLALMAGFASGFFGPSLNAGLPVLVSDEGLPAANSLLQTADNVGFILGPALGGLLVAIDGPSFVYLINAATFLVSACFVQRIPADRLQGERASSKGHWQDMIASFTVVRRQPLLLAVLCYWSLAAFGMSWGNVAEVVMALKVFSAGSVGLGLLATSAGLGSVAGGLAGSRLVAKYGPHLSAFGLGVMALSLGLAAISPSIWIVLPLFGGLGFANGAAIVCNSLLIQRGAPELLRGRAIATLMGIISLAVVIGLVGGGQAVAVLGARASWFGAAVTLAAACLCARLMLPRGFPTPQTVESEPTEHPNAAAT